MSTSDVSQTTRPEPETYPWDDYDEPYDDEPDGPEPGEECGRWRNGRLSQYCTKAGSEECDFECPYRSSLR